MTTCPKCNKLLKPIPPSTWMRGCRACKEGGCLEHEDSDTKLQRMLNEKHVEVCTGLSDANNGLSTAFKSMVLQDAEYQAVYNLGQAYKRLTYNLGMVDDRYPEERHCYESCMRSLIDALKANGRL